MATSVLDHVSDTARWVAMYRAIETDRPDALFRDPLARKLAGAAGENIAQTLNSGELAECVISVRTAVFDEIILKAIQNDGVDLVLNLAAGLDTRPYRLAVPESLRWVEVDFPALIAHKERVLGDEKPRCTVERIATDLSDVDARRAVLARIGAAGKRIFVLTEGLVMYLTPPQMASLASDVADVPSVAMWAMDLINPLIRTSINLAWWRHLRAGNSTMHFAPREGAAFFGPYGWKVREYHGFEEECLRLERMPLFSLPWYLMRSLAPKVALKLFEDVAGMVVLEHRGRRA